MIASIRKIHPIPWNNLRSIGQYCNRLQRSDSEALHVVQNRYLAIWFHPKDVLGSPQGDLG